MVEPIEEGQGAKGLATYSVISFKGDELPENYVGLVYSRWLRSFRFGNPRMKKMDSKEYYMKHHKFVEGLLTKPDALIRLAVLSDDHDVVLGFSASREDVLDYVHVQVDHRRTGIAKKLVPKSITTMTHMTQLAHRIWQEKFKELKLNPFA